ncbi:predicted protein [Arabidopsis lyrata subsp. lyrata]|uniref:Predicted protein n=1 Tax=Arabidopsis lyrata subsp. lyrata TaxID=81972 RepID=D7L2L2_ARALL|nr:predicted protein [Arabidopsis lyrata subsp. lyrata]
MTVTISSPPGLLVEVCSTHHGVAYSDLLVRFGLQAFMDHKSNFSIFLYVVFEPLISFLLYLDLFCLDA